MEGLLLQILANLSLHWIWSGRHIPYTIPSTVHVHCSQILQPDILFHTLAARGIPWITHSNTSELYTVLSGDTVLILANNPEDTIRVIKKASRVAGAFRARYFLMQCSYVDEKTIENLVRFAWKKHLTQVVVLRLEDSAIYAVLPKCHEPEIIRVSEVQWANLEKIDWSNCILKIAASNIAPYLIIHGGNDTPVSGIDAYFYSYAQAALHYRTIIIPSSLSNLTTQVMAGEVDLSYTPLFLSPNFPIELTPISASKLMWCVPAICVRVSATHVLWGEFTASTWVLLAASVFAIISTIRLLIPPNSSTLVDSLFMMLSTLALVPAKLPRGHARGVLGSWLLAMLVLGTAYQTALHSMMTAPLIKNKFENARDLINQNIPLTCLSTTCGSLKNLSKEDAVSAELAARTEEMETTTGLRFILSRQKTHAVYSTSSTCKNYYKKMRRLSGKGVARQYVGLFGFVPSSPLAPALRKLGLRSEAAGLWRKWFPLHVRKPICFGKKKLKPIKLARLWPAILLLCAGIVAAFIAFMTELWWHWIKGNMKLNCSNKKGKTDYEVHVKNQQK